MIFQASVAYVEFLQDISKRFLSNTSFILHLQLLILQLQLLHFAVLPHGAKHFFFYYFQYAPLWAGSLSFPTGSSLGFRNFTLRRTRLAW